MGIIPLIIGALLKNNVLMIGGGWVVIWAIINELWEMLVVYIFLRKGKLLSSYPFAPMAVIILFAALALDSILNLTFWPINLFDKLLEDDQEDD